MRALFFDFDGMPRYGVWCTAFLLVLLAQINLKQAHLKEEARNEEQAARLAAGGRDLQEAKLLLADARFMEATLKASSSMERLIGSPEYSVAQQVQTEAKRELFEWRRKQASKLLKDAVQASKRAGFAGGGLTQLRRVYVSACQIPPDSLPYKESLQLLDKATKRAMKKVPAGILRQNCEAVREGRIDPSQM